MNLKYMMLKNKYKFIHGYKPSLLDIEDNTRRCREASLYLKELALYGLSLKELSRLRPSLHVKDELLNIAYICIEEDSLYASISNLREFPVKAVCDYTDKPRIFIEKWQQLILAYVILLSKNGYTGLSSYLNIQRANSSGIASSEEAAALDVSSDTTTRKGKLTGMAIKLNKRSSYILTPTGDFARIRTDKSESLQTGYICSGSRLLEIKGYKPVIAAIIPLVLIFSVLAAFIYLRPKSTLLLKADCSIRIDINTFGRVVKVTPLSSNGIKISREIKAFNTTLDDSLLLILQKGRDMKLLQDTTRIEIYINGLKDEDIEIPKTHGFVKEHKYSILINNNGSELKLKQPDAKK